MADRITDDYLAPILIELDVKGVFQNYMRNRREEREEELVEWAESWNLALGYRPGAQDAGPEPREYFSKEEALPGYIFEPHSFNGRIPLGVDEIITTVFSPKIIETGEFRSKTIRKKLEKI